MERISNEAIEERSVPGQIETIEVAGKRIQLLTGGEGEPLLYLHGAGEPAVWLPFHDLLASQRRLFAPMHPGFGESEGFEEIDTIEDYAFHYLDFLDAQGWASADIIGLSFGGWIAAELATRAPERVRRLVLVDAAGLSVEGAPVPDFFAAMREPAKLREMLFADPHSAMAQMAIPPEPSPEQMLSSFRAMQSLARVGWNPIIQNPKLRGRLRRVAAKTLIVWGRQDRLIPPAHAEAYHQGIKDSRIVWIENAGHVPMLEQPQSFFSAVLPFINSSDAS